MSQKGQRRRLKVSEIVVGAIAADARSFAEAGRRCIDEIKLGAIRGPMGPGIVCMSFAIELWFKALGGIGGVAFASQLVGTLIGILIAVFGAAIVYGAIKNFAGLRLDAEEEYNGADLTIHKISATPGLDPRA